MDATQIKEFAKQIDDSLVEGHVYHINYSVLDRRTDSFYDHKKESIKALQEAISDDVSSQPPNSKDPVFVARQQKYHQMLEAMKRDLTLTKERSYTSDYSLDGVGFYLRQCVNVTGADGTKIPPQQAIYVSDGKIMGTFYPDNSRAVLQPATERPQIPFESWTNIAYRLLRDTMFSTVDAMTSLVMTQDSGQIVITGERPFEGKSRTTLEMRIDKATLTPVKCIIVYYESHGYLHTRIVKTWQYQDFAGLRLPKTVSDQYWETDRSGNVNLVNETIFTIDDFVPTPKNAKDEFNKLLKANYSVYDEITGTHYVSGNPGQALDNLSK